MYENVNLTDTTTLCGIKILDEKTKLLPIYFHSVGHYPRQQHVFRPDGFSHYQMAVCLSGNGVFAAEGKEYDIKRGDVFFFSPYMGHEYYPTCDGWRIIWLVFGGKEVGSLLDYFSVGKVKVGSFEKEEGLDGAVNYMNSLFKLYNENERHVYEMTLIMMKMVEILASLKKYDAYGNDDGNSDSFAPVLSYIKKNYYKYLSLEDLAEVAQMSKSHFCRMFKLDYKITPMAYLTRYRISVAKFLLATTEETVEIIAGKTGFPNTSYFCAVFRKNVGISPVQYQKKHKKIMNP